MLRSVTAAVQPPPASFPAAYASSSSSGCRATPSRSRGEWSQNIANHNMDGSGDRADAAATEEQLQADDVILHMLKTTGVLAYVALLHGCPAIFEAAALNNLTGGDWRCVAQCCSYALGSGCAGVSRQGFAMHQAPFSPPSVGRQTGCVTHSTRLALQPSSKATCNKAIAATHFNCCCCCRRGAPALAHALGVCCAPYEVQQAAEGTLQAGPEELCPPGQGSGRIRPEHPAGNTQLRVPAGLRNHRSKAAQQQRLPRATSRCVAGHASTACGSSGSRRVPSSNGSHSVTRSADRQ